MTPERWKRARELFDAAINKSPEEADAFLRMECADDADLYSEVWRMVHEHARAGPLDRPPWEPSGKSVPVFSADQLVAERFRIVRYIARGGMGEVYEADDLQMRERIALKTLLPAIASDEAMLLRFKQEIRLSRKIAHPNVCRVFDLAWHQPNPSSPPVFFLTMELLPGETLSERLQRRGRMSSADAMPLIEQMACGLDAAHGEGVVHRDFKASNVMLVDAGGKVRAVVTDFGLARSFSTSNESTDSLSSKVVGTLDYMGPELLSGAPASVRSDVYALGMVAYKMVTGVLPFTGETPLAAAILRAKKSMPSPRLRAPELTSEWEGSIMRALHADPAARFGSAGEFAKALRGEPVPSVAKSWRRVVLAGAAALLAVSAVLLAWQAWSRTRNQASPDAERLYSQGVEDIHAGAYFAATKALQRAVDLAPRFSLAHARLAESWFELDLPEKAGREFLPTRRQDNSFLPKIDQLQIEAVDLTITREFTLAAAKYEQMVRLARGDAGGLKVDLGRAYEKADKRDSAIESYRSAAEGTLHSPAAWLRLAVLYSQRADFAKSDAAFDQADQLYQLSSNLEGLTAVALQRGVAANRRGQRDKAEAYLTKAIERSHDAGNLQQEISAKLTLANNAYAAGDSDRAESLAREALATAQANQMEELAVRSYVNLGNAYFNKRDYEGAERHYGDALNAARRTNSSRLIALSQLSLANVHDQLRRSEEETAEASQALDYYQSNHWVQETFQCLTLLGRADLHRARYPEALKSFERLLTTAEKAQDRSQIALAHENIGNVLAVEENYPKALEHYELFLNGSPDNLRTVYAARECGFTLARLGRFQEAFVDFAKADEASTKYPGLQASNKRYRIKVFLSQGLWQDAIAGSRAALKDPGLNPLDSMDMTMTLGLALLRSGQRDVGIHKIEEALAAAEKLQDPGALLDTRIAMLEGRVTTRDATRAFGVFQQLEPTISALPETRWVATLLMAQLDPTYQNRASEAKTQLSALWGEAVFQQYLTRPDIYRLKWPVSRVNSAQH